MVMNVTLYKNSKVDNKSKMGYWRDNYSQQAYFNSLEKYSEDVKTVKLGEPLTVNLSVKQILDYNYGHIDYGDRFRYYFSIDDLRMVTETMTDVYYSIDCYETLVTQKPFRFGRANMTRQPTKPDKTIYNVDSDTVLDKYYKHRVSSDWATLIAIRWDSVNNRAYVIILTANQNKFRFFDGSWFTHFDIPGTQSEIIQCVVTKGALFNIEEGKIYYIISDPAGYEILRTSCKRLFGANSPIISSDINNANGSIEAIQDNRGNIIFEAEKGKSYTLNDTVKVALGFDGISILLSFQNNNKTVTLPLEPVSFMVDNWAEYSYRQRAIDKEMRNLQMNKQLISEIGQSVGNAGNTAAFGKMGGGGSAGMGLMAMAGGIVSAGINYGTNAYFSPEEQKLIDKSYQYANDELTNYGEFTYWELMDSKLGIVNLKMDGDSANRGDIETNGYLTISAYDTFVLTRGKWKGDVELLDINTNWASQIQERFRNGVDVV